MIALPLLKGSAKLDLYAYLLCRIILFARINISYHSFNKLAAVQPAISEQSPSRAFDLTSRFRSGCLIHKATVTVLNKYSLSLRNP